MQVFILTMYGFCPEKGIDFFKELLCRKYFLCKFLFILG